MVTRVPPGRVKVWVRHGCTPSARGRKETPMHEDVLPADGEERVRRRTGALGARAPVCPGRGEPLAPEGAPDPARGDGHHDGQDGTRAITMRTVTKRRENHDAS